MLPTVRILKEGKAASFWSMHAPKIRGLTQVLITLALLALVWWATVLSVNVSLWLTAARILLVSLFACACLRECTNVVMTACFALSDSIVPLIFSWACCQACHSTCGRSITVITMHTTATGRNTA